MKHALFAALAFGLAACAAPSTEAPSAWLGIDLSCNASEAQRCPAGGCSGQEDETWAAPISLLAPGSGGVGRFCLATGCENARVTPTQTRALGWTARVDTNDRTEMSMELEITRDRSAFRLRHADGGTLTTWSGSCQAAGS